MGNQNKGNLEKYKASDWSKLSRRAIGPRGHRSSKIKRRMVQYIQSRTDLTPSAKLAGAILVNWYNERLGYSWPSTATLASELGLGVRSVQRATGELDELGVVHKVVGGGWDKAKIRHKANLYYPAFSLVLENAETPGNLRKHPASLASPSNWQGTNGEYRRNSAEVPRQNGTPYGDRHMANAYASPDTADASTGSLAPAPESDLDGISLEWEEEESSEQEYSTIALACSVAVKTPAGQIWALLNFDTLRFRKPLSDNTRFGLDQFAFEARCAADQDPSKVETLAGDEYDVLITRPPGCLSTVQGMPCGDWKAEVTNHENFANLGIDCRVKVAFWD